MSAAVSSARVTVLATALGWGAALGFQGVTVPVTHWRFPGGVFSGLEWLMGWSAAPAVVVAGILTATWLRRFLTRPAPAPPTGIVVGWPVPKSPRRSAPNRRRAA